LQRGVWVLFSAYHPAVVAPAPCCPCPHCSSFPPHEQLLTAAVGDAVMVVAVIILVLAIVVVVQWGVLSRLCCPRSQVRWWYLIILSPCSFCCCCLSSHPLSTLRTVARSGSGGCWIPQALGNTGVAGAYLVSTHCSGLPGPS
jgi:hypothetical protein